MTNTTHEPIAQLHDFVIQQAEDDAGLAVEDRKWQAIVVAEILEQEALAKEVFERLFGEYKDKVAFVNQN
jgi:hypothetical protein